MMKPFKLPYRVALAGGLSAAAVGLIVGTLWSAARRIGGKTPLSPGALAGGAIVTGISFAVRYYWPLQRRLGSAAVYLTFDDGPDPEVTPIILDALAEYHGHGTFFVLGASVEKHPDLTARIEREGHTIGIHGYHHHAVTLQAPRTIGRDLDQTLAAFRAAGASGLIRLYRPPYLLRGPGLGTALRARGLRMTLLTLDSHDYLSRSPDPIRQRLAERLQAGDIVVLHDEGETGRATAAAIRGILKDMEQKGLRSRAL